MDAGLVHYLATHGDIVTAREARVAGIRPEKIRTALEEGQLVRVVRGGYVARSAMLAAAYEARHILRTSVVLRTRSGGIAASHTSAAAMWGLPVPASEMERIHVCHRTKKGTTRLHREFTVHCWPGEDTIVSVASPLLLPSGVTWPGVPAVANLTGSSEASDAAMPSRPSVPARLGAAPPDIPVVLPAVAAIQSALITRTSIGVSIMDAVRHRGLATVDQLEEWSERMRFVPGIPHAREALARSDGLAESPKESWLRLILIDLGYQVLAQHPISEDGRVFARVDFFLPELGVVVEFDGRVKYVKDDGTGDGDAVYDEKQREDRIRRLGFGVVRVGSNDLRNPGLIDRHIKDAALTVRR